MNETIYHSSDLSGELSTIVEDAIREGVDVHFKFLGLLKKAKEAKGITGTRAELVDLQRHYAKTATGLRMRHDKRLHELIRVLDERINAMPDPAVAVVLVDDKGKENSATVFDMRSLPRLLRK